MISISAPDTHIDNSTKLKTRCFMVFFQLCLVPIPIPPFCYRQSWSNGI
jgi:hypothetical protein